MGGDSNGYLVAILGPPLAGAMVAIIGSEVAIIRDRRPVRPRGPRAYRRPGAVEPEEASVWSSARTLRGSSSGRSRFIAFRIPPDRVLGAIPSCRTAFVTLPEPSVFVSRNVARTSSSTGALREG